MALSRLQGRAGERRWHELKLLMDLNEYTTAEDAARGATFLATALYRLAC